LRRELKEPPSEEGVLQDAADSLVRGRMGVAAGCAVVGLGPALGWPPWPPATLLVAALLFALVTLCFAVANHHRAPRSIVARVVLLSLLLAVDATIVVASALPAAPILQVLLGFALAVLLTLHVRALARILAGRPATPADPTLRADALNEAWVRSREAIGIVRARAESLRLSAEEAGVGGLLAHDLDVLVRQAEECQRTLARLPPRGAPGRRATGETNRDEWPSESTPLRS